MLDIAANNDITSVVFLSFSNSEHLYSHKKQVRLKGAGHHISILSYPDITAGTRKLWAQKGFYISLVCSMFSHRLAAKTHTPGQIIVTFQLNLGIQQHTVNFFFFFFLSSNSSLKKRPSSTVTTEIFPNQHSPLSGKVEGGSQHFLGQASTQGQLGFSRSNVFQSQRTIRPCSRRKRNKNRHDSCEQIWLWQGSELQNRNSSFEPQPGWRRVLWWSLCILFVLSTS